ncbi:MAG: CpaE family protein [Acidimicrobiales bacterium]
MSGITLVSGSPALETAIVGLYGQSLPVRRVWSPHWHDPAEAAMDCCAADPELLVVGSDVGRNGARVLVPEIDRRFPATSVVVLVRGDDPGLALDLLRFGARDVLHESMDARALRAELDRHLDTARARRHHAAQTAATPRRRVVTVLSPKGGSGKTTVATNVALALARHHPNKALLLDLDTQFGDCASALGLRPQHSIVEALRAVNHERSTLKVFLATHPTGLALLAPPDDLAAAEEIQTESLKPLIGALAEEFPFVVVDTASGVDSRSLAALEQSTDFLFVASTDVPSIRALRRLVDVLDQVGFVSPRRTFVLNRATAKVGLSIDDIETAVGLPVDFEIPSNRAIAVATNEGVPVSERDRGGLARRFELIAEHFAPRYDEPTRRGRRAQRKDRP